MITSNSFTTALTFISNPATNDSYLIVFMNFYFKGMRLASDKPTLKAAAGKAIKEEKNSALSTTSSKTLEA